MTREEILKRAMLLIWGGMAICLCAAILATIAAALQRWDLWAVNGIIIAVASICVLRNLQIRRELS